MKYVLAAGGTAGHINPALALAEELDMRGHELIVVGTQRGLEAELVSQAGFRFVGVECSGFDRAHPLSLLKALHSTRLAARSLEKLFKTEEVSAVIGFGAYVELPAIFAARRLSIPYALHEQNSLAGMAHSLVAARADLIALSYEAARPQFERGSRRNSSREIVVTGNPVRRLVREADPFLSRQKLGLDEEAQVVSVFGGSLGALHLNETLIQLAPQLLAQPHRVVIHASGKADYERSVRQLEEVLAQAGCSSKERLRYRLLPYIDDMGAVLAVSDCAITRAGASTLSELVASGTPALLVPYPFARADHQRTNAQELVAIGGALMIDDAHLLENHDKILEFVRSVDELGKMKTALLHYKASKAHQQLADSLEAMVERN